MSAEFGSLEDAKAIVRMTERAGALGAELTRFHAAASDVGMSVALTYCAARALKLVAEEMAACPCGQCKPVPASLLDAIDELIAAHEAERAAAVAGANFHGARGEA